jgi:hypothetical protein
MNMARRSANPRSDTATGGDAPVGARASSRTLVLRLAIVLVVLLGVGDPATAHVDPAECDTSPGPS